MPGVDLDTAQVIISGLSRMEQKLDGTITAVHGMQVEMATLRGANITERVKALEEFVHASPGNLKDALREERATWQAALREERAECSKLIEDAATRKTKSEDRAEKDALDLEARVAAIENTIRETRGYSAGVYAVVGFLVSIPSLISIILNLLRS